MPITTTTSNDGQVLEITLDRPKANTIDAATSQELSRIYDAFNRDATQRVAIFTAAGEKFFSAGLDLNAANDGESFDSDYGVGGFGGFPELPNRNKPVIAAVNGMAVGGGFEIAMAADFIVAAEHATFFLAETKVGVIPDAGTIRLPRLLPRQLSNEIIFGGRRLTAHEAASFGIVNRVVALADRMQEIAAAAREQSSSLAQINEAITDLDSVTQQNAAMVEQATAAAASLRNEADALARLVGRFRIDSSQPAALAA